MRFGGQDSGHQIMDCPRVTSSEVTFAPGSFLFRDFPRGFVASPSSEGCSRLDSPNGLALVPRGALRSQCTERAQSTIPQHTLAKPKN